MFERLKEISSEVLCCEGGVFTRDKMNELSREYDSLVELMRDLMGKGALELLHAQQMMEAAEIMRSSEFQEAVEDGKITLGLRKPQLHQSLAEGVNLGETDREVDEFLDDLIRKESGLEVLFSMSMVFSEVDLREFYAGLDEKLSKKKAKDSRYANAWEEFVGFMTSGAITVFIMYDHEGDAVRKWREFIGVTDPIEAKEKNPGSIRALYAKDFRKNLVHGSDGIEAVRNELGVVLDTLDVWEMDVVADPEPDAA